jgi:C4-dicarboxylate-specific signal transduction histidine kinase
MNQTQIINQLFFVIFGLILSSLFIGTFRAGFDANGRSTRGYWLLSLGTRAGAFFSWASIPMLGPVGMMAANGLFVFSAGCMALMFRSWRVNVSQRLPLLLFVFCLMVAATMEWLRQTSPYFPIRMLVLIAASLAMSTWELAELRKKLLDDEEPSLKLIAAVVMVQMVMSGAAVISSLQQAQQNIAYITDNGTQSMLLVWLTMTVHLVIYLFVAGYLFRRALMRELTAIKQRNDVTSLLDERERLLASLIASNRVASTGALSASVAHEMSQPLTAAMLKLGLLRRSIESNSDDREKPLSLLNEAVDDIGRSKDVLDHLRALFRQTPPTLKKRNIHELVEQTITLMQSRLDAAQIRLKYSSHGAVHAAIVDKEIQQVLINLINNAADSLGSASQREKLIQVTVANRADTVTITVADNGPGIQPELVDTLFELVRSNKPNSMGIGLWISRHIVEDHHRGRLYVEHGNAQGARFVIELPKNLQESAAVAASPT